MLKFHVITMSTYGVGLSGGDRIWIELSRRIAKKYPIFIYLWEDGKAIAKREELNDKNLILWSAKKWSKCGFFINYFARVLISIFRALELKLENNSQTIIYSASEFWQDSIPAAILKLRYSKITWIAAWYQTAPNPFRGFYEKGGINLWPDLKTLLYWLVQQPIKPIINKYADLIFITSDPDTKQFPRHQELNKIIVIKGGVDLEQIRKYKRNFHRARKIYDAIFQGRLHPQKGVLQLVDIWKKVVSKRPKAKLAMIGDGPLMKELKIKIKSYKLEKNIKLFGYIFDGYKKYKIFSQSKIVVHPAYYDSGGMAAAEAMAFGMPAIAFDLESLHTYYSSGMIKIPIGNIELFAKTLLKLLNNHYLYSETGKAASQLIKNFWSWDSLVNRILGKLNRLESFN